MGRLDTCGVSEVNAMRLTPEDWGRYRAYPILVDCLIETTRYKGSPCARLILYLNYARITLEGSNPSYSAGLEFKLTGVAQSVELA
jgi:hypothetical protein